MAEPSPIEVRHLRASYLVVVAEIAGFILRLSLGYLAVDRVTYSSDWIR